MSKRTSSPDRRESVLTQSSAQSPSSPAPPRDNLTVARTRHQASAPPIFELDGSDDSDSDDPPTPRPGPDRSVVQGSAQLPRPPPATFEPFSGAPTHADNPPNPAVLLNQRPPRKEWFKASSWDLAALAVMGIALLPIYLVPEPTAHEAFYPASQYPIRSKPMPVWLPALLFTVIPIAVILLMQYRIRSFWDANNAILGLAYALVTTTVFEGLIHRFTTLPSGHSNPSFAAAVFLFLYLNGKLKLFANYHPDYCKLVAAYCPLLGAVLLSGTLKRDESWYDIWAAALIGTMMAFSSYRMVYADVWDFRWNHIPLSRYVPFQYSTVTTAYDNFHDTVFTRECLWGSERVGDVKGAPGDVAGEATTAVRHFSGNTAPNVRRAA